jgi:16S rRNA (guanine527-N7)-methyltransferase
VRSAVEVIAYVAPEQLADAASTVFGARIGLAERYAGLLSTVGIEHGLLGPREADRIWDRHLLNSAVVAELLPQDARVVDVGSGAGLPGLALACARADLRVRLVESMARRVEFLRTCIAELGLADQVSVLTGRMEDQGVVDAVGGASWVTARAVAPLDRLARWCLPLLRKDGRLLAIKGARARDEVREFNAAVSRLGGSVESVVECGAGIVSDPATVVVVLKR